MLDRLALIKEADLSAATAQTTGMVRTAAISGDLVGASSLWMGRTTLPAGRLQATITTAIPRPASTWSPAARSSSSATRTQPS